MPQLRTAETMDLTSPVASPEPLQQGTPMTDGIQDDAEQAYPQRSMSLGSEQYQQQQPQPPQQVILGSAMADDAEQVRPWSSMSFPSGHQQRQPEPTSRLEADEHTMPEAGSRTPQQKQLDWQHGKPVSMSSPGAVPASTPKDKEDLHKAMLAQLELQDREVRPDQVHKLIIVGCYLAAHAKHTGLSSPWSCQASLVQAAYMQSSQSVHTCLGPSTIIAKRNMVIPLFLIEKCEELRRWRRS